VHKEKSRSAEGCLTPFAAGRLMSLERER
jgi:hypothetical protein